MEMHFNFISIYNTIYVRTISTNNTHSFESMYVVFICAFICILIYYITLILFIIILYINNNMEFNSRK